MWGLLERDLAHPALAPVRAWFDANVPPSSRAARLGRRPHEPLPASRCALRAEIRRRRCPTTAMVMAAGLGKRMRPLTATRPKPLVEVAGKPLIDHALDRLQAAGVAKAVVNVHYLADALEAHLKNRAEGIEITISDERKLLLETGGGLVRALPLIDADPFLAVNATISGSTARPTRCACSPRTGTRRGWTRCCCSCRSPAPIATAATAIST